MVIIVGEEATIYYYSVDHWYDREHPLLLLAVYTYKRHIIFRGWQAYRRALSMIKPINE